MKKYRSLDKSFEIANCIFRRRKYFYIFGVGRDAFYNFFCNNFTKNRRNSIANLKIFRYFTSIKFIGIVESLQPRALSGAQCSILKRVYATRRRRRAKVSCNGWRRSIGKKSGICVLEIAFGNFNEKDEIRLEDKYGRK